MFFDKSVADKTRNTVVSSSLSESVKTGPCWMGIDEAGRGPVLGAMVYGACFSPISKKDEFQTMGFADSKVLTEEKREELFNEINSSQDLVGWTVEILSPTYISNSMLRRSKYNLNALSHDCAIGLIRRTLEAGVNITDVYIDTVGDPSKYQEKLLQLFPELSITVAKKADSLYTIVSAASICAKVARDQVLKAWQFPDGSLYTSDTIGSGYPNDPATKKYMNENIDPVFGYPDIVRFSWSTASLLLEKHAVPVHWDDEEDDSKQDAPSVFSYFSLDRCKPQRERHSFFTDRFLSSVKSL